MIDVQELKAKYEFWRASKLEVGKHFDFFFDVSRPEAISIKILKKYPGVIIEFSGIQMVTDQDMSYDFDVIANPNLCDVESNRFKRYTSAIFRSIILKSVENAKKELNENRNTDLVEFDAERVLHEESVAVSEERVSDRKPRKKTVRRNKRVRSEVQQSATDSSTGDQS
jgi:hypothetical protein